MQSKILCNVRSYEIDENKRYPLSSFIHSTVFTSFSYYSKDFNSGFIFLSSYRSTLYLQYMQLELRKANIVLRANAIEYHLRDKRIRLKENVIIFVLLSESYQIELLVLTYYLTFLIFV